MAHRNYPEKLIVCLPCAYEMARPNEGAPSKLHEQMMKHKVGNIK
jgi:hypothetical protein